MITAKEAIEQLMKLNHARSNNELEIKLGIPTNTITVWKKKDYLIPKLQLLCRRQGVILGSPFDPPKSSANKGRAKASPKIKTAKEAIKQLMILNNIHTYGALERKLNLSHNTLKLWEKKDYFTQKLQLICRQHGV